MLAKKKHAAFLQPLAVRCRLVEEYLNDFYDGLLIELFPLEDGYGPYTRSISPSPQTSIPSWYRKKPSLEA